MQWNHSPLSINRCHRPFSGSPGCFTYPGLSPLTARCPLYITSLQFTMSHAHLSFTCMFRLWPAWVFYSSFCHLWFNFPLLLVPSTSNANTLFVYRLCLQVVTPLVRSYLWRGCIIISWQKRGRCHHEPHPKGVHLTQFLCEAQPQSRWSLVNLVLGLHSFNIHCFSGV